MAEFKLGRLRFVWQGTWQTSYNYVKDDIVSYGGNTYVCLIGNTSSSTTVGFNADLGSGYWSLMQQGVSWKNTWTQNTNYKVNDIVRVGAKDYICVAGHNSTNTANTGFYTDLNSNYWQLLVNGIEWSSTWAPSTFYNLGDIVKVGGKDYICILQNQSSSVANSGFYSDLASSYWSLMVDGVQYRSGNWAPSTFYNIGDIVKVGAKNYRCLIANTSSSGALGFYTDLGNGDWALQTDGIEWISAGWTTSTYYYIGDIVRVGGNDYICLAGHQSSSTANSGFYTDLSANNWQILLTGSNWRSSWATSTFYNVGDIVKYGAKDYICIANNTSSSTTLGFYTDLGNSYWQLYVDGTEWLGSWAASTAYKIGDIVLYGGIVYICINGHTSGSTLETNQGSWQTFTTGFNWLGVYTNGPTTYKVNDIVRYGADLYICTSAYTTSTSTIDLTKWSLFVAGLEYQNSYSASVSYALGDVVTYGGYVYSSISTNNLNNTPSTSSSYWSVVTTGFNTRGAWSASANPQYRTGDVVTYGGYVYVAILNNANTNPAVDTVSWSLLSTGFSWQGPWVTSTSYRLGDSVSYGSSSYVCILAHTSGYNGGSSPATSSNNRPDVDTTGIYWNLLAGGVATNVTTTIGDLIYYAPTGNARLAIGTDGQVLKAGTISTGVVPTWGTYGQLNDIYYVAPSGLNNGALISATTYTSLTGTSVTAAATYNNVLPLSTSGTGTGATFTITKSTASTNYSGNTTIAFVLQGQGYAVGDTITISGASLGGTAPTNNLTFTISSAVASGYGYTIDKPWQTVAYACQQALNGPANPNAVSIIRQNKAFLQAEVNNYIQYTYKASVTGTSASAFTTANTSGLNVGMPIRFTGLTGGLTINGTAVSITITYYVQSIVTNTSFTVSTTYQGSAATAAGTGTGVANFYYNSTQTLSDAGNIIDGILNDLGRGGNDVTVINALAYFSTETAYSTTFITTPTAYSITQIVGSLNFLSTLITTNILTNTSESPTYQSLNSVGSPVAQTITSLTAENGAGTKVTSLVSIVTTALNAKTTAAIPAATKPNITIFLKTGVYNEVLPITVPTFTSLVGDELRAVTIQPYTFTATATSSSSTTLNVSSGVGIINGMGVQGNQYIPDGTYVVSGGGTTTLTLNQATTGNVTGTITVGYTMSNMFYMRDATIARNFSVKGLFGALGTANSYGTKRPTGGAYFSLDPGTGTTDDTVWIKSRSPYIQNVSLFGTACVGMKIDGSLHGGGNRSMVANDFTNVLSDGIAIWCTNLGLTEQVSTFSYYAYAGYLADGGGRIRATNGNSSYGTYGVVSEGGNAAETAITAVVNTQTTGATVGYVLTGGGQILWLEYNNAGQTYSSATYAITSGSGVGASVSAANYATYGITEVRVYNGGSGYLTATNVAQGGTAYTLRLSAADSASSNAYNGMRIVLYSGTGAGQYGFVNYFNAANKVAQILNENFTPLTITTTSGSAPVVFSIASTSTIPVGTAIVFQGTPFGGVSNNTIYYVVSANFTSTTFSVATTSGGTAITLTSGSGTMTIYQAGWNVAVTGTPVITTLDGTTRYVVEPRVTFGGPGTGALARAVVSSYQISAIRIINPGTGFNTSVTVTATAITNNIITANNSLTAGQVIYFNTTFSGLTANILYYVLPTNLTSTQFTVSTAPGGTAVTITNTITGLSNTGFVSPVVTITDPNATLAASLTPRVGTSGVLAQPSWTSRGTGYTDAAITITGNGYADYQAVGYYITVSSLTAIPVAGSNIVFAGNPIYYSIVQVVSYTGSPGSYQALIQINPGTTVANAPVNLTAATITIQYSQVRLTGHDFLYVGSGNFFSTGYPSNFSTANKIPANQTLNSGAGRVFFTSTDQDGNFNVGNLFNVAQATGVATLNASLFNLSGLNQLQFASGGATVTQFSTDGSMTSNSDSLVPTQRAVRAYIASQLGAGGSNISANSVTAGNVVINGQTITTQNANDLILSAITGNYIQVNTQTYLNSPTIVTNTGTLTINNGATLTASSGATITVASGGTLVLNGTATQNAIPVNSTDVTNKQYVDRILSTKNLWAGAW